jgi:hypothetical protein
MAKNHVELRDALFDSSGYLADLLTRCAFIEEQFYRDPGPVRQNIEKERSIVRTYVAILQYSARVRRVQQSGTGRDIMESITDGPSTQLAQLKLTIEKEESHLHHWLLLDEFCSSSLSVPITHFPCSAQIQKVPVCFSGLAPLAFLCGRVRNRISKQFPNEQDIDFFNSVPILSSTRSGLFQRGVLHHPSLGVPHFSEWMIGQWAL